MAVHDILIHPRDNDLILGTHGRALWIFDDATPLQQWSEDLAEANTHLFPIRRSLRFPTRFTRYGLGDKSHKAPNPPAGALITYFLAEKLDLPPEQDESTPEETEESEVAVAEQDEERLEIEILDASGEILRTLDSEKLGKEAGLNRVAWDLSMDPAFQRRPPDPAFIEFRGGPRGPMVLPGTYTVRLTLDGEIFEQPVEIGIDPLVDVTIADLGKQFQTASELRDMQSILNAGLRGLDVVAEQLEARRETLDRLEQELATETEEAWKSHDEAREALMNSLTRADGKPFWSQGPRLADQIGNLFGNVDNQFASPTRAQLDLLGELKSEYEEKMAELQNYFNESIPELNAQMESAGVPPLAVSTFPPVSEAP